jgi:streptogramin lyase
MRRTRSRLLASVLSAGLCCFAAVLPVLTGAVPAALADEGQVTEFAIPTANSAPDGITSAPDGNLWVAERLGNKIARITPSGAITEYPIPTPASEPLAILVGPDGALWFTEFKGNRIGRITLAGEITEFPIPTPDSKPHGIAVGPDGNLWFTELNADTIGRITPDGEITEFPIPTRDSWPSIITAAPDGNLWFGEWKGDRIGRITTDGIVTEFVTPTAASQPHGITVGPDGNLWFTEFGSGKIGTVTMSGSVTEFAIPTPDSKPAFIATGADGNLWFTEFNGNRIGRITTSGAITEYVLPGSGDYAPTPPESSLWGPCEVRQEWADRPAWPSCSGACPIGITAGPDGNLWFTEFRANKIGRITDLPRPVAKVRPSSGTPGTPFAATGTGFGSYEEVTLSFIDPQGGGTPLGTVTADAGGGFSAEVAVPLDAARGRHRVTSVGAISGLRADRPFLVT